MIPGDGPKTTNRRINPDILHVPSFFRTRSKVATVRGGGYRRAAQAARADCPGLTGGRAGPGIEACRKMTVGSTGARPKSQATEAFKSRPVSERCSTHGVIPHHTNGSGGRGSVTPDRRGGTRQQRHIGGSGEDRPRPPWDSSILGARDRRGRTNTPVPVGMSGA